MSKPIQTYHLPPQSGVAFRMKRGQILQIIDPSGEQVSDLTAFVDNCEGREWLSSGRSIDYADTIYLTTGHVLYSNDSRPLLTITRDDVGRHDFLLTPCSPETFQIIYHDFDYHPSCFENLWRNLEPFGIAPHQIPTTLNVFMNVMVDGETGKLTIGPPLSKAGDVFEVRAEADLIVGVTACSAEKSNNGTFKPIDVAVFDATG